MQLNFVNNHRLSKQNWHQTCKKRVCNVYRFQLSFHFACHRWWLGGSVRSSSISPRMCFSLSISKLFFEISVWVFLSYFIGSRQRSFFLPSCVTSPLFFPPLAPFSTCPVTCQEIGLPETGTATQPPTVACKMEAQLKCVPTHCINFLARLASTRMLNWQLLTKFLHYSSVGCLLRVRCWLGSTVYSQLSKSTFQVAS